MVRQVLEQRGVVLSELVQGRLREGKKTYVFLDAYDTVWRNGLWVKMWELGVRGKMWRLNSSHSIRAIDHAPR